MKQNYLTPPGFTFRLQPFGITTALFLLFFLLNISSGFGQANCTINSSALDPTDESPIPLDLNFEGLINRELIEEDFVITNGEIRSFERGIPEFIQKDPHIPLVNFDLDVKPGEISFDFDKTGALLAERLAKSIISITEVNNSHLLLLTFGDGVKDLNKNGNITNEKFINSSELNSPLDIEATNYLQNPNPQIVYIADKNDLMIKRFNNAGIRLSNWGTGALGDGENEFYGPTGLVSDSEYVYLADAYTGGADGLDLVKIYDHQGNLEYTLSEETGYDFYDPYRIAVDKEGRIYVADGESDSDEDLGRIQIFQKNPDLDKYELIHTIKGEDIDELGAPGSMVIDDYGYLYVIDYEDDLTLSSIYESPEDLILNYDEIVSKKYSINVYDTNQGNFNLVHTFNDGLNLPIDLEIGNCGKIYVNNLKLSGPGLNPNWIQMVLTPFLFPGQNVIETNFNFELRIFTRHDNFTAEVIPKEEGLVEVSLNAENEFFPCDPQPECEFLLFYGEEELQPVVTCPDNSDLQNLSLDGNCEYELPAFADIIETDNFNDLDFSVNENRVDNTLNVEVGVLENGELIETCQLQFTLIDEIEPAITCPLNIAREIPAGEDSIIINYDLPEVSDNCSENLTPTLVDGLASGNEFKEGIHTIEFEVIDEVGLTANCSFTITVTQADSEAPEIECINQKIFLDKNGQAVLDPNSVYNGERNDLQLSVSPENFDCSSLGENTVILTATDPETGLSSSCTTEVLVMDDIAPETNCITPGREFQLENGSVTISPSAIDLNSTDNCEITRTLSEDTFTTPGTKNITLYVEDTAGNIAECTASIEILPDDEEPDNRDYTCIPEAEIPDISLDENCTPQFPYYTELIETDNFTPDFTQIPEQLTEETYLITIEIRDEATGELVGECSFSANLVDLIPPTISCLDDQRESFDPETGFEVPDYENMAGVSDNCGEVSFRQDPEAGEIIYTNTTVNLFVEDENGLEASCSFELELTETDVLNITCQIDKNVSPDDNCSFWLPDYTGTAEVNFDGAQITQTPPPGSIITENTQIQLTASLNGETDDCYFMVNLVDDETPVASCVSGFVVNLDNSGNASITPEELDNSSTDNCGIVSMSLSQTEFNRSDIGEVPVTLTVRDDAGNMDSCETTVEVVEEPSGAFQCRENIALSLDENGEARLDLQDLYTGDATDFSLEASRLNFSCSDLGEVEIQLNYTGEQNGSCMINVEVRDEIPPYIGTDLVELSLDNEGFAYLKQEDILAEDNCSEELIYRFDRSLFTCKDVGYNMVNVEVEDANGNIAEKLIELDITGEQCDTPEDNEIKFPILYPNPSDGIFTIATPEGMFIERIRVFDSRGRYIMQQDYSGNARFYRMSILAVAESVYTLQIFTNEGVTVKRVIIKR
ncbi:putative secreted protein (Por secretion system target) [Salegentibacter sp. 24]|uniref:HYR domain-containing protein n=1 Tax=Salegentibacter sp. 24 TaxID=2183986 RepID=UPI00105D7608|nr:HYR domain-containing protein [Salegentibacter sp. 24]TDN88723.1 putative secreted protein (Por secretion system target) [Salegentibacter sp. 24]